ncbi:MAG: hypothetical protein OHK0026_13000 [Rhodocyclaceae bacterium]
MDRGEPDPVSLQAEAVPVTGAPPEGTELESVQERVFPYEEPLVVQEEEVKPHEYE